MANTKKSRILPIVRNRNNTHPLRDTTDIYQFDIIYWEFSFDLPPNIKARKVQSSLSGGKPKTIDGFMEAHFLRDDSAKLEKWVRAGGVLIIPLGSILPTVYDDAELFGFLQQLWPFEDIRFVAVQGDQVVADEALGGNAVFINATYKYELVSSQLTPLIWARQLVKSGKRKLVSGAFRHGNGAVVFGPVVNDLDLCHWLAGSAKQVVSKSREPLPAWVGNILLPDEFNATTTIIGLRKQITELESKIAAQHVFIDEAQDLKALIAGTDKQAEEAVRKVLRQLQVEASAEVGSRADTVALWNGIPLAIEVKGVEGTAREAYVSQVRTWMADVDHAMHCIQDQSLDRDDVCNLYIEKLKTIGVDEGHIPANECRGLLVVVNHNKHPLEQRAKLDHPFPDAVDKSLVRSGIVGITGVQLLLLFLQARKDQAKERELLELLFSGVGGSCKIEGNLDLLRPAPIA